MKVVNKYGMLSDLRDYLTEYMLCYSPEGPDLLEEEIEWILAQIEKENK